MPLTRTNLNPPFNITRASHVVLNSRNPAASRTLCCDRQCILRMTIWFNDRRQRASLDEHWLQMIPDPDQRTVD
jgi:hypothetical protein